METCGQLGTRSTRRTCRPKALRNSPASLKTEASSHAILTSLSARRLKGQNSCTSKSDYSPKDAKKSPCSCEPSSTSSPIALPWLRLSCQRPYINYPLQRKPGSPLRCLQQLPHTLRRYHCSSALQSSVFPCFQNC